MKLFANSCFWYCGSHWVVLDCNFIFNSCLSTIQYNTVQYSTVQYSTVQYNTIQYSTIQYNIVQYSTIQYSTVQYNTVQYSTVQYSTIQYSTVQYNTVQYRTALRPSCWHKAANMEDSLIWRSEQKEAYMTQRQIDLIGQCLRGYRCIGEQVD